MKCILPFENIIVQLTLNYITRLNQPDFQGLQCIAYYVAPRFCFRGKKNEFSQGQSGSFFLWRKAGSRHRA